MNDDDGIGQYYKRAAEEKDEAWAKLQAARAKVPQDPKEIKALEEAYEIACYVGD